MRKSFFWLGFLIGLGFFVLNSQTISAQGLILDSLIAQALQVNPNLKSAELRYEEYLAKVPQAGSLPDPMFQTTLSNISTKSWTLGKTSSSGIEFMFSQSIPFFGKLGLAKKSTQSMAEKTKKDYDATKNFIISELKKNYYQLYLLHKSIEITQANKQLLEDFAKIGATKYSVGEGLQQDVLKAQVEVSKMIAELLDLEEMRKTTQAKLNILLNRNPQDSLGKPEELSFKEINYSEENLQNLAIQNNPAIKGIEFMIRSSELEYKLAQREYWPNLLLSFSYMKMKDDANMSSNPEKDFVSASIGLELPLYFWTKQKKMVQEKRLDLKATRKEYEGMKNELKSEVSMLFYSLNKYKKEMELLKTVILPQAQQSLESAKFAYQVNKVDFLTLLDNQVTLYNYEIDYQKKLASYLQTLAQLEETIGKPLF